MRTQIFIIIALLAVSQAFDINAEHLSGAEGFLHKNLGPELDILKIIEKELDAQTLSKIPVKVIHNSETDKLASKEPVFFQPSSSVEAPEGTITINFNDTILYQTMEGYGAALTDSSAWVLWNLNQTQRTYVLTKLFDAEHGIGVSYIRLPVSACDFSLTNWTYDNLPEGQTDPNLDLFSIDHDLVYIIPVLKEILAINPDLKIVISPWSPPFWMKNIPYLLGQYGNDQSYLLPQFYKSLALYFLKTIQGYAGQGITIQSMTIQNEPLYTPTTYPGMGMDAVNQTLFINDYLVPVLKNASVYVRIYVYDHNWDQTIYPLTVLAGLNQEAYEYVYGVAFHCYAGNVSNQTQVHDQYPDKPMLLTECSGGTWGPSNSSDMVNDQINLLTGSALTWSTGTMKWNIVLNQALGPQNNGCNDCWPFIMVNETDGNTLTYFDDYYSIGIFSKYVRPNATRVEVSSSNSNLLVTGFINTDQTRVLYVTNLAANYESFQVNWQDQSFSTELPGQTVAAYVWV